MSLYLMDGSKRHEGSSKKTTAIAIQWNGHSRSWTEKCSQDLGDLHKLEVLEKLEAKLKSEGKEEENEEGEGDDEADESEGHYLFQETALPISHTSSLHLLHCRQTLDSTQTHHLEEALVHSLLRKRSSFPSHPRPRIPAAS